MHLSANAVARHLTLMKDSPLYELTYFFDEVLGHILWDSGIILLSLGLILLGLIPNEKNKQHPNRIFIVLGSILYGFTFFVNGVEGQTVVFTAPVAAAVPAGIVLFSKGRGASFRKQQVSLFFLFSYSVAVVLFILWGIWKQGFPQFSELGWI